MSQIKPGSMSQIKPGSMSQIEAGSMCYVRLAYLGNLAVGTVGWGWGWLQG
jgi:hypothetical protein